jgi:hypothetical protein
LRQPECRQGIAKVFDEHFHSIPTPVDGIFWDFFSPNLWLDPDIEPTLEGEPDIDGDGIGHFEDEDEMEAFRESERSLVMDVTAVLGEDFLQVFNGRLGYYDSTFAALGDGLFYERLPQMFGEQDNMVRALDPEFPFSLWASRHWPRKRNGGPFIILANKAEIGFTDHRGEYYRLNLGDVNRVVALMMDCAVVYNTPRVWSYGWPEVELHLGQPLGPPVRDGQTMSRQFRHGQATLTLTTGEFPLPFAFEIVQNGEVVQALDPPYHFP